MRKFVVGCCIFLLSACGETSSSPAADSATGSIGNTGARADINSSCCFTNEEQFLPFFPQLADTTSGFTLHRGARDISITCPTDTLQQSYCISGYYNTDSQLVSVKIIDYCPFDNRAIDSTYIGTLRAYRSDQSASEFNEFEVAGVYHGFACYLPVNKFAILSVVVDERFIIEISHHRAANSKSVLSLFGLMPVQQLAKFRK